MATMKGQSERSTHIGVAAIVIVFVVLTAGNILVLIKITGALTEFSNLHQKSQSLPCPAIPTRLILEDPACAQKLLDSMNVTDVRIRPGERVTPRAGNGSPNGRQYVPGAAVEW